MSSINKFPRRSILGSLPASALLSPAALSAEGASADERLLHLGREFTEVAADIDRAIDGGTDLADVWLDRLGRLDADIAAAPATTLAGLCVKARAACWARLGDLDPPDEATIDHRMALSIIRDLVRLHDPGLERPGALQRLVEDNASDAGGKRVHTRALEILSKSDPSP
jgi:hypothetical protein